MKPKAIANFPRRMATIEMNIPHGAMASYALLGAELVDWDVDGLEIVALVNSNGPPLVQSLALKSDEVRLGLPDEYTGAVIEAVKAAADSLELPIKACLRFRWAAHGLVGSSPWVFQHVAGLVIKLLALPQGASEKQISRLFE